MTSTVKHGEISGEHSTRDTDGTEGCALMLRAALEARYA